MKQRNGGENVVCDFDEIIGNPIFIGCDPELLEREISTNMWAISLDDTPIKHISIDTLSQFIDNFVDKKQQQLAELNISCSVIFYLWFDEMAAQLRFNIISYFNGKLPFGCNLNIIDSPQPILKAFLHSQQNPEISWDDLQEIMDDFDEIEEKTFVLDVFIQELKRYA